jgi:hypothetical protein
MTPEKARKLNILSRQLTESLMSASLCAKEINELAHAQPDDNFDRNPSASRNGHGRNGSKAMHRPLLDEAILSVIWKGRTLHLGHTQGFWLLTRLARRANQYITHLDLLREIWDDEFADTCILRARPDGGRTSQERHSGVSSNVTALAHTASRQHEVLFVEGTLPAAECGTIRSARPR